MRQERATELKSTTISTMVLICSLLGVSLSGESQQTTKRQKISNRPPVISSITASSREIGLCPWAHAGECGDEDGLVSLITVDASDPNGDQLSYKYSVTGGKIQGQGPKAQWDFKGVLPGLYILTVKVTDGHGAWSSRSTNVKVEWCGVCDPPRPVITVSCPDAVDEGQVADCTLAIAGGDQKAKLKFKWSVSAGKIKKGQGRSNVEVDTTGVIGPLVVTVEVGGFDPAFSNTASCTIEVQKKTR